MLYAMRIAAWSVGWHELVMTTPDLDMPFSRSPSHPACSALRTYCAIAPIACISPHAAIGMSSALERGLT